MRVDKNSGVKKAKQRRLKPRNKQNRITEILRGQIVSGKYPPGAKLPVQLELMESLSVSSVTVQRALHELKTQGFLSAKRRSGTFVVEHPPHLSKYALVFPQSPISSPIWSNFYEVLRQHSQELGEEIGKPIDCFYDIEGFEHSPDYLRLEKLAKKHLLAGIFFAAPPFKFLDTPLMSEEIPRVAIASPEYEKLGIPILTPNGRKVMLQGVDHLLASGKSRIGLFATTQKIVDEWLKICPQFASRGLETRQHWCLAIPAILPGTAKSCIQLMMNQPADQRPDGLMILDDHLTQPVEQALMELFGTECKEVSLVAQCNFPDRFGHNLPIKRIGFHAMDLLRKGIALIDAQRARKKVPAMTLIDPVSEDLEPFTPGSTTTV